MVYQYSVELDIDDNRLYTNGLCKLEHVTVLEWNAGMNAPYAQISNPAGLRITLSNHDGRYNLNNPSALYYGKIFPGRLVRVRTIYNGTTVTMTELRITDVPETFGEFVRMPQIQISCSDKIAELLAFEYAPVLQQNVRVDEALTELHKSAHAVWPNNRSYFFIDKDSINGSKLIYDLDDTDFEEARTTLEWVGDHLGQTGQSNAQRFIRDLMKVEVFGMYFFQPRTGKYRFLNRHHATEEVSAATLRTDGDYMVAATPRRGSNPYGNGPLNRITLNYMPRSTGAAGSVLYASDSVPFSMRPDTTKKIRGRFFDPDNDDARVGGVDMMPLQNNVDIMANSQENGLGTDLLNQLSVSYTIKASGIEFILENQAAQRIWITKLQVRGTPLISFKKENIEAVNVDSLYAYDPFEATDSLIESDEEQTQRIGDMLVTLFGEPRFVIERLNLVVTTAIAAAVQTLTMGGAITIQNIDGTHNTIYIIVGEQHRVNIGKGLHEVSYVLRSAEYLSLFLIDSSVIDGPDVLDI